MPKNMTGLLGGNARIVGDVGGFERLTVVKFGLNPFLHAHGGQVLHFPRDIFFDAAQGEKRYRKEIGRDIALTRKRLCRSPFCRDIF